MDTIVKVVPTKSLGKTVSVCITFASGRVEAFGILKVDGKVVYRHGKSLTSDEIKQAAQLAKVDGKWQSFGNEAAELKDIADRARNRELDEMVKNGEAIYTYDSDGMIDGVEIITKTATADFSFDSSHGIEG